jgi:hypothetical protein
LTVLETIADKVAKQIERKVMFITLPQREEIRKMMVREFQSVCVEQGNLRFEADEAIEGEQAAKILNLLKQRRSAGATNVELAAIALKYTSRVSDLRTAPHNYRISCTREEGRTFRYRLDACDW